MIEIQATGDTTLHTAGQYVEEDILVKVPAGSGGSSGGASIETCTVTMVISNDDMPCTGCVQYTTIENGIIVPTYISVDAPGTVSFSTIKGSFCSFECSIDLMAVYNTFTIAGGELISITGGDGANGSILFFVGTSSDEINIAFAII